MFKFTCNPENPGMASDTLLLLKSAPDLKALITHIYNLYAIPYPLDEEDFKGDSGEVQIHYLSNGNRLFLLGVGDSPNFGDILKHCKNLAARHRNKWKKGLSLDFSIYQTLQVPIQEESWVEAALNGLALGLYHIGKWKEKTAPTEVINADAPFEFILYTAKEVASAAHRGLVMADVQTRIIELVNTPGNEKRPADLASWAIDSAHDYGYDAHVFDRQELEKMNMHAILAVGKGSEWPPYLIVLEYNPEKVANDTPHIGLVGKGVTFDTGGISLKSPTNMHYMKSDMGGAAAVFGAMEVAARLQLPIRLTAVVPAADNAIDSRSYRPGDVIGSYSGQTIEITDTDAEGRLILADALNYLKVRFDPAIMIDLATLTGSAVRTFGTHCAAFFSNDAELASQLAKTGENAGERLWQLPLWDLYKEDILSDIADLRNFSGKPAAGAISAAKFLEAFIDNHPKWAHLDIAGVAYANGDSGNQKSGTGFGVRLLTNFILQQLPE